MTANYLVNILDHLGQSVQLLGGKARITDMEKLRATINTLVNYSVFETGELQGMARYLARQIAQEAGIYPASINDLYLKRGRGEIPRSFTVPAMNLRALSYDAARAVFRAAQSMEAGAFIFEISRSEINFTDQRPAEYATNILLAALKEGYHGPVFIQGDHFQVSAKHYATTPENELQSLRDLIKEAIAAGFYNIDIDASTLVDLSQPELHQQQALNSSLSAMFTDFIRQHQPAGVTISVGGEIGEVGGKNSTEAELRAYMDGYIRELKCLDPGAVGLSKISIQTGTSHGGVLLPDGTIQEVTVDFDTLQQLSRVARQDYGMGGAVQHGASTLPESAFHKFVEAEATEVHLAANFMNMMFDRMPQTLRNLVYAYLDDKFAADRKPEMTDEQFYYKARKNALGQFKTETWDMPAKNRAEISQAWEEQFRKLFQLLGLQGTKQDVTEAVSPVMVHPDKKFYLGEAAGTEEESDLAD